MSAASDLSRVTRLLLIATLSLAAVHHVDHVFRVDHSGWPFRAIGTPFTFSLVAEPVVLFALIGPRRLFWWRLGLLFAATCATLYAHAALESPGMQYAMWAFNRSLDPRAPAGLTNLLDICSPGLGWASVAVGMALNLVAVAATIAMFRDRWRDERASLHARP